MTRPQPPPPSPPSQTQAALQKLRNAASQRVGYGVTGVRAWRKGAWSQSNRDGGEGVEGYGRGIVRLHHVPAYLCAASPPNPIPCHHPHNTPCHPPDCARPYFWPRHYFHAISCRAPGPAGEALHTPLLDEGKSMLCLPHCSWAGKGEGFFTGALLPISKCSFLFLGMHFSLSSCQLLPLYLGVSFSLAWCDLV